LNLLVLLIVLGVQQLVRVREPAGAMATLTRSWCRGWIIRGQREGWPGALVLALILLLPIVLVGLVLFLLSGIWHGVLAGVVSLAVMLVVLLDRAQPDVFTQEQESWLAVTWQDDVVLTQEELGALEAAAADELARARKNLLMAELHELFAPVFWFLFLGPLAVLTYYFLRLAAATAAADTEENIEVAAEPETSPEVKSEAKLMTATAMMANRILYYADWLVARVLGLSFALAGDFVAAWQHWRVYVFNRDIETASLLDESAAAAQWVDLRLSADVNPGIKLVAALAAVKALLHRALVIWIVLLALHTLWS
jgi:AmpE protein